MKARSFLENAIETLASRGGQYESGHEENSMAEIVYLHAYITPESEGSGFTLSELEGWFFMLALKLVRLRKSIEQNKASKDSIVDLLGYVAKMGECLFADEPESAKEPEEEFIFVQPPPILVERDCLHMVCTMKDIEGNLAIVCDDCGKVVTAREYVDGESEYEAGSDR